MSSQSKRRAESEEVTHKKRHRKGEEEEGDFNEGEDDDELDVEDDVGALDNGDIPTDRRTRGKRVDYTKVLPGLGHLGDDDGWEAEAEEEVSKENKGALAGPQTRSPQRKLAEGIEEDEEDDDDEEGGEYGEDEDDDDGTDEDEEE